MINQTEERFGLKPERLAAHTAQGAAPVLNWLVEEKDITPHIRVNDKIAARRWHPARDGATLYLRGRHSGFSPPHHDRLRHQ
jgi:hypothetical protein